MSGLRIVDASAEAWAIRPEPLLVCAVCHVDMPEADWLAHRDTERHTLRAKAYRKLDAQLARNGKTR